MKCVSWVIAFGLFALSFSLHAQSKLSSQCPSIEWENDRYIMIPAIHIVIKGDTLSRIAKQYGDRVSDILLRNNIAHGRKNKIEIGERFFVSIQPTRAHVSWYGPRFHGRKMANRKVYDMHDPTTVAHKKLPFGTKVLFKNPTNGRMIETEVRDRGPYIKGREFDLSKGAAEALGVVEQGVPHLEYLIICMPMQAELLYQQIYN